MKNISLIKKTKLKSIAYSAVSGFICAGMINVANADVVMPQNARNSMTLPVIFENIPSKTNNFIAEAEPEENNSEEDYSYDDYELDFNNPEAEKSESKMQKILKIAKWATIAGGAYIFFKYFLPKGSSSELIPSPTKTEAAPSKESYGNSENKDGTVLKDSDKISENKAINGTAAISGKTASEPGQKSADTHPEKKVSESKETKNSFFSRTKPKNTINSETSKTNSEKTAPLSEKNEKIYDFNEAGQVLSNMMSDFCGDKTDFPDYSAKLPSKSKFTDIYDIFADYVSDHTEMCGKKNAKWTDYISKEAKLNKNNGALPSFYRDFLPFDENGKLPKNLGNFNLYKTDNSGKIREEIRGALEGKIPVKERLLNMLKTFGSSRASYDDLPSYLEKLPDYLREKSGPITENEFLKIYDVFGEYVNDHPKTCKPGLLDGAKQVWYRHLQNEAQMRKNGASMPASHERAVILFDRDGKLIDVSNSYVIPERKIKLITVKSN